MQVHQTDGDGHSDKYSKNDQNKGYVSYQLQKLLQKIQVKDNNHLPPTFCTNRPTQQTIYFDESKRQSSLPQYFGSKVSNQSRNSSTSHYVDYEKIKDQPLYKGLLEQIINLRRQNEQLTHENKILRQNNLMNNNKYAILTEQKNKKIAQYQQLKRLYQQKCGQVVRGGNKFNSIEQQGGKQQYLRRKLQEQKQQLQKEIKLKKQKDDKINQLLDNLSKVKLENIHLMGVNQQVQDLNKKISSLMARNRILQSKAVGKTQTVRHLWEIKQIQYNNILYLLNKYKN